MVYYAPKFFILEYLRIHTFGHSAFTVSKIFNRVFTTLYLYLGYPVSYYLYFENLTPSQTFLNDFSNSCQMQT